MRCSCTCAEIARLCMAIIFLSVGLLATNASAESVLDPSFISVTAFGSEWHEYGSVNVVYDGTGLTGGLHDAAMTSSWGAGDYPWVTPVNGINEGNGCMNYAQFSFNKPYSLDGLKIWNLGDWMGGAPDGVHLGTKSVVVEYSTVANPSTPADWSDWYIGDFAEQSSSPVPYPVTQVLDLADVSAKHVALSMISDYGYPDGQTGGVYVGLSELQFAYLPEPEPVLDITVGPRTQMSTLQYENQNVVSISRTGTVAAFYQKPGGARYYRTSTDKGLTWGSETAFPPYPGTMSAALPGGGVVAMTGQATPVGGGNPPVASDLESTRILYSDDFSQFSTSTVSVTLPNATLQTKWAEFWPVWDKGKMIQLDNGDLLANMYGNLEGDAEYRTMLMQSSDQGQSWQYRSTVAYSATDPNPELPGGFCGFCESSITLLANGQLLAMMRTQGSHIGPDYRPMYTAWSDDLGLTWTEPEPTDLPLLNVWPTLITLDNGVVACVYGRPGVHVAFSTDHGHTWSDIETFSTLPTTGLPGTITGYADMVQAGPNDLVVIAGIEGGTYVWPISVDLAGDVDGDGFVGGDDLTIILTNWGSSGMTREQGDLTGEGFVGGDDYTEVLTYWGTGIGLGAVLASVPEPTVLLLLSFAGTLFFRRRTPKRA